MAAKIQTINIHFWYKQIKFNRWNKTLYDATTTLELRFNKFISDKNMTAKIQMYKMLTKYILVENIAIFLIYIY